ncbi:hypothetical protein J2W28_004491 [Variovorax boronicumulans]|nr:hypothetical protein [Variovorax boronicumulans]MDQ0005329.1 hypothetical protein [Variovorax boronicumulans]
MNYVTNNLTAVGQKLPFDRAVQFAWKQTVGALAHHPFH